MMTGCHIGAHTAKSGSLHATNSLPLDARTLTGSVVSLPDEDKVAYQYTHQNLLSIQGTGSLLLETLNTYRFSVSCLPDDDKMAYRCTPSPACVQSNAADWLKVGKVPHAVYLHSGTAAVCTIS